MRPTPQNSAAEIWTPTDDPTPSAVAAHPSSAPRAMIAVATQGDANQRGTAALRARASSMREQRQKQTFMASTKARSDTNPTDVPCIPMPLL